MEKEKFLHKKINTILKRERINKLITKKINSGKVLYISAPSGWGKTSAAAEYVYDVWKKEYEWIDVNETEVDIEIKNRLKNDKLLTIIDNMELCSNSQIDDIIHVIKKSDRNHKYILIGQSRISKHFSDIMSYNKINTISADDLIYTKCDIKKLFLDHNICLQKNELDAISDYSNGWPFCVGVVLNLAIHNNSIINAVNQSEKYINNFIEKLIWNGLSLDFQMLLICLTDVKYIPIKLCKAFVRNKHRRSDYKFDKIFITNEYGYYTISERIRSFIKLKEESFNHCNEDIKKIYNRLAEWFYNHENEVEAVNLYLKSGNYERIDFVIKNSSDIYSNLIKVNAIKRLINKISLENLEGYKGICELLELHGKDDEEYFFINNKNVALHESLINIMQIEDEYEKGNIEKSLYMTMREIKASKDIEKIIMLNMHLQKIFCSKGDRNTADKILHNIAEIVIKKGLFYLLPYINIYAVKTLLLKGNIDKRTQNIFDFHENTYENNAGFLYIKSQFLKLRICISEGRYTKGLMLIENLSDIIDKYNYKIIKIKYLILKSIILLKNNLQEESFIEIEKAVELAESNNYIRVFADEGEECFKVIHCYLKHIRKKNDCKINLQYINKILNDTGKFAMLYPKYLVHNTKTDSLRITKSELSIINLLSRGMSNKEISECLNIKVDTVKFHTKNIYLKLNVKNRLEAVKAAKEKNIIQ